MYHGPAAAGARARARSTVVASTRSLRALICRSIRSASHRSCIYRFGGRVGRVAIGVTCNYAGCGHLAHRGVMAAIAQLIGMFVGWRRGPCASTCMVAAP